MLVMRCQYTNLQCLLLCLVLPYPTRSLLPVTQLYVSVDASTKESLKKVDRPLFRDFWPRFIHSLKALAEKVCSPYSKSLKESASNNRMSCLEFI